MQNKLGRDEPLPRTGRPYKLSEHEQKVVRKFCLGEKHAVFTSGELEKIVGQVVHPESTHRVLRNAGVNAIKEKKNCINIGKSD